MAQRVVVHIGLMKSGTTFIQGRLGTNRRVLRQQDVLFPGPTWRRHVNAVSDFMGLRNRVPGAWVSLVEEIDAFPGTAVISMEYLTMLGPKRIPELAGSFRSPDVRIVIGARDLGRTVPAMWQEAVKNRSVATYAEYLAAIEDGTRTEIGRRFWRQQDAGQVVARWAEQLAPEQVYLVTLPPPGHPVEVLWDRFRSVVGIQDSAWAEAPRSNESLGAASASVVRLLNESTLDLDTRGYKRRVKGLAKHLMPAHREQEDPIGYTVPAWLHARADEIRQQIESSGARVVGHLGDLTPQDVPGADPDAVSPSAQRDALLVALEATLRQLPRITRPSE
jgi:hypothetical protein